MPADWVALRPKKNGELRGYGRDIAAPLPTKRRNRLPNRLAERIRYGVPDNMMAASLDTLFSVKELLREMRINMPDRRIRKKVTTYLNLKKYRRLNEPSK